MKENHNKLKNIAGLVTTLPYRELLQLAAKVEETPATMPTAERLLVASESILAEKSPEPAAR